MSLNPSEKSSLKYTKCWYKVHQSVLAQRLTVYLKCVKMPVFSMEFGVEGMVFRVRILPTYDIVESCNKC